MGLKLVNSIKWGLNFPTHSIENKFVNIKVKCKGVICSPNFVGERGKNKLMNMLFIRLN